MRTPSLLEGLHTPAHDASGDPALGDYLRIGINDVQHPGTRKDSRALLLTHLDQVLQRKG